MKRILARIDKLFYFISKLFFRSPDAIESGRQFLTFAVIGVANTAIDFSIYIFLTRHISLFYFRTNGRYIANTISFLAATTFSFGANRTWTFRRSGRPTWNETLRFYATTLSGLLVNNAGLYVLSTIIGANDILSKIFSTVFSTTWNFMLKKLWVFSDKT